MADITLFGLKINKDGAIQAIREITEKSQQLAKDGAKSAQLYADAYQEKLNRVARQTIPETMRAIDNLRERQVQLAQGAAPVVRAFEDINAVADRESAELEKLLVSQRQVEEQQKALAASAETVAASSNNAFAGFGRIRQGLTSLIAQMTGTIPVLDRIGGQFLAMGVGGPIAIAAIAGIAAVALAYHYLTKDARDAEAAQDAALKKLQEWANQKRLGPNQFGNEVNQAAGAQERTGNTRGFLGGIAGALNSIGGAGAGVGGAIDAYLEANRKGYEKEVADVKLGEAAVANETRKGLIERRALQEQQLADLVQSGQATKQQRALLVADLAKDERELAALRGKTDADSLAIQAGLVNMADAARQKLNPEDKDGERAEKAAQKEREKSIKLVNHTLMENFKEYYGALEKLSKEAAAQDKRDRKEAADAIIKEHEREQASYIKLAKDGQKVINEVQARDAAEQKKYAEDMTNIWRRGFEQIAVSGLKSFSSFFSEVDRLFVRLMERMEKASDTGGLGYKLLSLGQKAITGGVAGFNIGQQSGNAAVGALGGAAVGFATGGIPGAVAGFVGGLLGSGKAAREHAKALAEAQAALTTSIAGLKAEVAGDSLGSAIAGVNANRQALIKQAEDAYAGGSAGSANVRTRAAVEAQINSLEDQKIAKLKEEFALSQRYAAEDYAVRTLRAKGLDAEADATALAESQEREYAAAVKAGADATALATLAVAQAAEADQRRAAAALATARAEEDARLRLSAALGGPGAEAAARAAQERREVEDLVAKGASAATIELTKLAQAAEDAASAAAKAAAQQQASENLNVELLRAKGQGGQADDLQFQLDQQRRLEQAQKEQSSDYVDKLKELQQLQRDQRAAQQLIDSTGSGGGSSSAGATSALTTVNGSVTQNTALILVDIARAELTTLDKIEANTRNGGAGGGGLVVNVTQNFGTGDFTDAANELVDEIERKVDERLGGRLDLQHLFMGRVQR